MINQDWARILEDSNPKLLNVLRIVDFSDDFAPLEEMLDQVRRRDPLFRGENDAKYRKMLAYAAVDKIVPSIRRALILGTIPTIEISKDDGERAARRINVSIPKSPQDFLYSFISERSPGWVLTLSEMGFLSATMTGNQVMTLMVTPRLLELSKMTPNSEFIEPSTALSEEFRETMTILAEQPNANVIRRALGPEKWEQFGLDEITDVGVIPELIESLRAVMAQTSARESVQIQLAISEIEEKVLSRDGISNRNRELKKFIGATVDDAPRQEQLALKFLDDGRYLQRLLSGVSVEEISSNLKMQPNRLRGNKVEVDRVYKVGGQQRVLLVETKGGSKVSRGQLYQLYETFALRLPVHWDVDVIAVLLYRSTRQSTAGDTIPVNVLDVAVIDFDDNYFGDPSLATLKMSVKNHFRWLIPDFQSPQ